MDESAFHDARRAAVRHPCAFEKALLAGHGRCPRAARHAIAEREVLSCTSPPAAARCARFHELLRRNADFALGLKPGDAALPHAKHMKLQCGGLDGLHAVLMREGRIDDVGDLVEAAFVLYGGLEALPYSEIMRAVAAFRARRRH